GLDEPVRQRACAGIAFGTGRLCRLIDQPIAIAEAGDGGRDEIGLIGRERCQMADPGSAHTKAEEGKRQDTAARCRDRAEEASRRHEPLTTLWTGYGFFQVDRHLQDDASCSGYRIKDIFPCALSQLRERTACRSVNFPA